jgi:orotate phosphoribosyltransferase
MDEFAYHVADAALESGAIKIDPEHPFLWPSGQYMPIIVDMQRFMLDPRHRRMIAAGLELVMMRQGTRAEVIAGMESAGISPGTSLADRTGLHYVTVREKPQDYGWNRLIEGIDPEKDLEGRRVLPITDLIITGERSRNAITAIRAANGTCADCLAIFNYDLLLANGPFEKLEPACVVGSLLGYDELLIVARNYGRIHREQDTLLEEWHADPFGWGEKHGHPKVDIE